MAVEERIGRKVKENKLKFVELTYIYIYIGYSRSPEWGIKRKKENRKGGKKKKIGGISIMPFHERATRKTRGSSGILSPDVPNVADTFTVAISIFRVFPSPFTPAKSFSPHPVRFCQRRRGDGFPSR